MAIDEKQPISKLLKSSTKIAHDLVANSPTAIRLLSAQMPLTEFIKYDIWLHELYDTLEITLTKNLSDPKLSPLSRLDVLARQPALASDITNMLQINTEKGLTWREHPFAMCILQQLPESLQRYRKRIEECSPIQLASHAYVRYLGDLSGGQILQKKLGKAYNLDQLDAKAFFDFPPLNPQAEFPANSQEVKNIKEWFRNALDLIADNEDKQLMIDEASKAFIYNSEMFIDLEKHKIVNLPALPELNNSKDVENQNDLNKQSRDNTINKVIAILAVIILMLVISIFL